jgi:N-methylhydantoinase A/oxoprolinase/acetone carboxylase beta subunit
MRIGVDVGGTNTDAALLDGSTVVASLKAPTSEDVGSGVVASIRRLLSTARVAPEAIDGVMIGTTQFTNAFVERVRLNNVAAIRICLPAARSLNPLVDWPRDLLMAVGQRVYLVGGGYEFDGQLIAPLDEAAVAEAAREIRKAGITAVAISCVFSPIDAAMEQRAAEIVRNEIPGVRVTLSNELGRMGLIERENAAVMNASLADLSERVVNSFGEALHSLGVSAPFFISQNDGTLMSADFVARYPVLTFASGPTNSMRGAAYLSGRKDAIVVDIGGTTTDVGVLVNGFPRESSLAVDIGGVRTNFRMPDILAIGLGGGTRVDPDDPRRIGPQSVGYRLPREALVFGGETLTTTDIAVAAGVADIGDRARVRHLGAAFVEAAMDEIHRKLEQAIDRMKTSADNMAVVLVGGGSVLVDRELKGVSELLIPERSSEANAIGAAIAQVGGEVDRVFHYAETGRDAALEQARGEAVRRVIDAGAEPGSASIIEIEELPLSYAPRGAVRVRVKAVGDLAAGRQLQPATERV